MCVIHTLFAGPLSIREKESPRLMHVVALHFTLYLFWGAALVSERGVLVRKEIRSGVRKGWSE